jgi:hypothetical protein
MEMHGPFLVALRYQGQTVFNVRNVSTASEAVNVMQEARRGHPYADKNAPDGEWRVGMTPGLGVRIYDANNTDVTEECQDEAFHAGLQMVAKKLREF